MNLALAARAKYVVTRDNDLLALMDESRPEARQFAKLFGSLRIIEPQTLLRETSPMKRPLKISGLVPLKPNPPELDR